MTERAGVSHPLRPPSLDPTAATVDGAEATLLQVPAPIGRAVGRLPAAEPEWIWGSRPARPAIS